MITCKIIKKTVEDVSGFSDISIKRRDNSIVDARYAYFKLCSLFKDKKKLQNNSLKHIGEVVRRDHATVLHGINKFDILYRYEDFNGGNIFNACLKQLEFYLLPGNEDIEMLKTEKEIKQHYLIRSAKLSEKYRSVINKLSYKLQNYRKNPLMDRIAELSEEDSLELEERFDVFFRVKNKLK